MSKAFKIGVFDDEKKFISSIKLLKEGEYNIHDVFTPYPIHEVFHLLKRRSHLPTAAYFFGLFGIIATLAFLYYTSVIDWPIVYGGKPFNSFPSFIVVTIIITILTVTILSLALFSARSKLFPDEKIQFLTIEQLMISLLLWWKPIFLMVPHQGKPGI